MGTMRGRGHALAVLVSIAVALGSAGCGDTGADRAAPGSPSTTSATAATTAKIVPAASASANVTDAPHEAVVERSDSSGYFVVGPDRTAGSTRGAVDIDDPLSFIVICESDDDAHGTCRAELTNNVTRVAHFPGGLKVTVLLARAGAEAAEIVLEPGTVDSLEPGAMAEVQGAFDLSAPGHYNYEATTTVAWP